MRLCDKLYSAAQIGYTQELWESDKESSCCREEDWDDLSKEQQHAATLLGYNQKSWDNARHSNNRFSILCFLMGSLFYLKLSFLNLGWLKYMSGHVPESLVDEDDDEVWSQWAAKDENRAEILEVRENYYDQYELFNILATSTFVAMGLREVHRERNRANLILVMAGLAGLAGARSSTEQVAEYWNCVSVHLFLLSCTSLNLFFVGSILECVVSYLSLAGYKELWVTYADMIACFLWLFCALKEVSHEFDFSSAYWKQSYKKKNRD
jgi:hypothetical protein